MKLWQTAFFLFISVPAFATQTIDPRQYVDWKTYPYNQLVFLTYVTSGLDFNCTAQYVAPNVILTARHCVTTSAKYDEWAQKNKKEYIMFLADGTSTTDIELERYGYDNDYEDWALLRVTNPKFFSRTPLPMVPETTTGTVSSVGFAEMRILTDEEIEKYRDTLNNNCQGISECPDGCDADCLANALSLSDMDPNYNANYKLDGSTYKVRVNRLKTHRNCQIVEYNGSVPSSWNSGESRFLKFRSTCRTSKNDSGGAYINSDNVVRAIISYGRGNITSPDEKFRDWPQPIETDLYNAFKTLAGKLATTETNATPAKTDASDDDDSQTGLSVVPVVTDDATSDETSDETSDPTPRASQIKRQLATTGAEITTAVKRGNLTQEQTFDVLFNISNYQVLQRQYNDALAREQSTANKLLGGLTMAATGIGGQMLASGQAEQRADENAERDMRAYLATFRCDYGQGRNIIGGETNIQLPGGNDLAQYVTEYKQLATSLKAAKDALGLAPGLESEIISDSATTGLYDNAGTGRTQGAFTSLSRALTDNTSADAQDWATQKSDANTKTKTGLTVGATGAGAGLVGNVVINDILKSDKKSGADKTTE